jgi:hypothetical protein
VPGDVSWPGPSINTKLINWGPKVKAVVHGEYQLLFLIATSDRVRLTAE